MSPPGIAVKEALNRAMHAFQSGRLAEAVRLCQAVLDARADDVNSRHLLACCQLLRGDHGIALQQFDSVVALAPTFAMAHANRAVALRRLGRHQEALASVDRAIALQPDSFDAQCNRCAILNDLGRPAEALASGERAVALRPQSSQAQNNRAEALRQLKRWNEALAGYDRALALEPSLAEAHANRGAVLARLKQHGAALDSLTRAAALQPGLPYVLGDWLNSKMHACSWDGLASAMSGILAQVAQGRPVINPFHLLATAATPAQQQQCARIFSRDRNPAAGETLWRGECYGHERIRIGYFSADFHNHATAHLATELFERHDRERFEIIAFSFGPVVRDAWRQRLERAFDRFIDVSRESDLQIASLARRLEIDIAVDLKGHTQDQRTRIFAHRPAPIQVSYLGYPGTMGAAYMDYLIADPVLIPSENRRFYDEKIAYLPNSYQPNDSTKSIADEAVTRGEQGLPEDAFVFCCFNNSYKITPDVFDVWMRLLRKIHGSVLWLLESNGEVSGNLRREASARGVDPARLIFAPRMGLTRHLARHRCADLFLDTFHCNAHTTASDALWSGLPVLTCLGTTFAGRVAASLLMAVGLPELVAGSPAAYEALAVELAGDRGRLATLRGRLAANRTTMPLFDTARYVGDLEAAYQAMFRRHCDGLAPDHILLDDLGPARAP